MNFAKASWDRLCLLRPSSTSLTKTSTLVLLGNPERVWTNSHQMTKLPMKRFSFQKMGQQPEVTSLMRQQVTRFASSFGFMITSRTDRSSPVTDLCKRQARHECQKG